jgi:hypothetical protein
MRRLYSILVLLLLAGSAMSSLAMQAAPGIHDERPSGCHEHGKKAPAHQPADYACCVAGHSSALVRASCVPQPQQVSGVLTLTAPFIDVPAMTGNAALQVSSGSPPNHSPLRI